MFTLCKRIFIFGLLVFSFYLYNHANAQPIPSGVAVTPNQLIDFTQSVAGFLIIIGTVLAGISIVYSGVKYMLAGSDSSKVKGAKDALKAGLIGAAIVFGVGIIISTIQSLAGNPIGFF